LNEKQAGLRCRIQRGDAWTLSSRSQYRGIQFDAGDLVSLREAFVTEKWFQRSQFIGGTGAMVGALSSLIAFPLAQVQDGRVNNEPSLDCHEYESISHPVSRDTGSVASWRRSGRQ